MSATAERSCVVRPQDYLTHSFNQSFGNGQGKKATTIRAEQGHYVTLVTDEPYTVRNRCSSYMPRARKGARPMHASTLTIPVQDYTDYYTTNARLPSDSKKKFNNTIQNNSYIEFIKAFSGKRGLEPWEIARPYPSQHLSKVTIPHKGAEDSKPWATNYYNTFYDKGVNSPAKLHYPSQVNKLNMTEGEAIKRIMTAPGPIPSTMSQYTRVHNRLGVQLGPGVEREMPVRKAYNILTGEETGSAWKSDNKRTSGNRVLYHSYRQDADRFFVLG